MVPALPEALAHVTANPPRNADDLPPPVGVAEVVPPASNLALPLIAQVSAGRILPSRPEFLDASFEPRDRLWREADFSSQGTIECVLLIEAPACVFHQRQGLVASIKVRIYGRNLHLLTNTD